MTFKAYVLQNTSCKTLARLSARGPIVIYAARVTHRFFRQSGAQRPYGLAQAIGVASRQVGYRSQGQRLAGRKDRVVGIHLERTGATVITGSRIETQRAGQDVEPDLKLGPRSLDKFPWSQDSKADAVEKVQYIAQTVARTGGKNLYAVGVAGPGPFLSLRRRDIETGRFGRIHPTRSHLPLQGLNLYSTFKSELRNSPEADVVIHTDAVACAIGEAIIRETSQRTMLAFFIIGDGIGLGIVRGRSPLRSALHPEIGLLEVRPHKDEGKAFPIRKYNAGKSYSVAQMASNLALKERCKSGASSIKDALASVSKDEQEQILDCRAYYLAQMCLACTVTLAPHQIVLGEDVDLEPDLAAHVRRHFTTLTKSRSNQRQPLFEYAELDDPAYISNARVAERISPVRSLGTTGALGMLYAALVAEKDKDGKFRPEID